jgi:hypothetical protein
VTEAGKIDSTFDRRATQRQQRPAATVAEE